MNHIKRGQIYEKEIADVSSITLTLHGLHDFCIKLRIAISFDV